MSLFLALISQLATFAAAFAFSVSLADDVIATVRMAFRAMSSSFSKVASLAALYVHRECDGFQMSRVDAAANAAQMVDDQTFLNFSNMKFIRNSVSQLRFAFHLNPTISNVVNAGHPEPTTGVRFGRDGTHQPMQQSCSAPVRVLAFAPCILTLGHVTPFSRIAQGCMRVKSTLAACFDFTQVSEPHTIIL